jgi:hypothetical protein
MLPPDGGRGYPAAMQSLWFPAAQAATAIAACRHAAALLSDDLGPRPSWADQARDSWQGPYRRQFDATFPGIVHEAGDLRDRLNALAGAIGRAQAATEAENRRRASARADFDRQKAAAAAAADQSSTASPRS